MDTSIFFTSICVSITYILLKYIEMRFVLKEPKPLKLLFRDSLIVYFSVVGGFFVFNQFNDLPIENVTPNVFTNDPGF